MVVGGAKGLVRLEVENGEFTREPVADSGVEVFEDGPLNEGTGGIWTRSSAALTLDPGPDKGLSSGIETRGLATAEGDVGGASVISVSTAGILGGVIA